MFTAHFSRRAALGGLGAVAVASLIGCGRGNSSEDLAEVVYQLSWTHSVQFGGTYLARDRGFFDDEGLNVQLAAGGPNVAGDANTVSGGSLVNISAADGVARSNAEGADLVIVAAQYQKFPGTILSLAEAPLEKPEDLIGARIAVAGADTPGLDAFLATNGITSDQVEFIPSQYDPAVLTAKQADGLFCFYNDLPVALDVQGVAGHSLLLADFGYNPMSQVYTVRRETLEDSAARDQLLRLLRADFRGWELYREDPEAAAELTVKAFPDAGLDLETQRKQADVQLDIMFSETTDTHGFGWFTDEQVSNNLELFEALGIPGASADLWDRSLLEEIYRDGPSA